MPMKNEDKGKDKQLLISEAVNNFKNYKSVNDKDEDKNKNI